MEHRRERGDPDHTMLTVLNNIGACYKCLAVRGHTHHNGVRACPKDGKPIREHADVGTTCPLGKHKPVEGAAAAAPVAQAGGGCGGCGDGIPEESRSAMKFPVPGEGGWTLSKLWKGAVGLSKAAAIKAGLAPELAAPQRLVKARLEVCSRPCQHLTGPQCGKCGCFVVPKSLVLSESCPAKLWPDPAAYVPNTSGHEKT